MSKSKGGGFRPMSPKAASHIQSVAAKNPTGKTAVSGFAQRAQAAGAANSNTGGQSTSK